jgi:Na+/H+-dicarboxylate symporter
MPPAATSRWSRLTISASKLFLNASKMLIVPLIASSIAPGVTVNLNGSALDVFGEELPRVERSGPS